MAAHVRLTRHRSDPKKAESQDSGKREGRLLSSLGPCTPQIYGTSRPTIVPIGGIWHRPRVISMVRYLRPSQTWALMQFHSHEPAGPNLLADDPIKISDCHYVAAAAVSTALSGLLTWSRFEGRSVGAGTWWNWLFALRGSSRVHRVSSNVAPRLGMCKYEKAMTGTSIEPF